MQRKTISAPLSIHNLFRLRLLCLGGLLRFPARQPAHHAAQLRADDFDGMLLFFLPEFVEVVAAVFFFFDPLASESSILNVGEGFLHGSAGGVANDFFAASKVAILGGVRD